MKAIMIWYLTILLIGIILQPLTLRLFAGFRDKGYLAAKPLGLFLSGWLLWSLNCLHVLRFTQRNAILILAIFLVIGFASFLIQKDRLYESLPPLRLILFEEVLFFVLFLVSLYIIGFKPEAYGTEKFMDYGFLTVLSRSLWMPFEDPWYSGQPVNYYYGGQYLTAFLMKLSGVTPGEAYNLMRATITALSFVLPFALVRQLLLDRLPKRRLLSIPAALLGGIAVAFSGNGHYVLFRWIRHFMGMDADDPYWFPDSTRYIGYNPDIADKTIHEFPAYSSVLGDLHAHYINLIFVLTVLFIVYAWAQKALVRQPLSKAEGQKISLREILRESFRIEVLLIGFFTGAFRWTNFWDFPIYYVVAGSILFFVNLRRYQKQLLDWLFVMIGSAAVMFAVGVLAARPFTAAFDQISSEIGRTYSHTAFDQLVILWGLPFVALITYMILLFTERKKDQQGNVFLRLMNGINALPLPDLTVLFFGLCAAGLVWLPEIIYVKDIYGAEHYRANTMFKLTYQAFILFAIVMAYAASRLIFKKKHPARLAGGVLTVCLLVTGGYIVNAVGDWFGNVLDRSRFISVDASVFVSEYFSSDFAAISWLNENVTERARILEAPGDSYTDYERVSVATGLPTVAGWYVHEWLWRGGHDKLDTRVADIQAIYTATAAEEAKALLKKYGVRYLYVGKLEHDKYPEIDDAVLTSLGEVVYSDDSGTYIVELPGENDN